MPADPLDEPLLRSLLANAFGSAVDITEVAPLGRGNVWRVTLAGGLGSVIAKREGRDPTGFFDDVACLRALAGTGVAPTLLAYSAEPRLFVMEDVAGVSVAEYLLEGDAESAASALVGLADALAMTHGAFIGRVAEYDTARAALGPERQRRLRHQPRAWTTLIDRLAAAKVVADVDALRSDFAVVDDLMNDPGEFRTVVHGDPCPDNTAVADRVRLFDFEWGGVAHALLDACYVEVPFPTCWCYGSIPEPIVRRCEESYRGRFVEFCPVAADDDVWGRNLAAASASWWLTGIDEFLAPAFDDDGVWGTVSLRQRVIHRTSRFGDMCRRNRALPHLGAAADHLAAAWRRSWDETEDVALYPAFR